MKFQQFTEYPLKSRSLKIFGVTNFRWGTSSPKLFHTEIYPNPTLISRNRKVDGRVPSRVPSLLTEWNQVRFIAFFFLFKGKFLKALLEIHARL